MRSAARSGTVNWKAAAWLGLVSSTYSTLISTFLGARIGRDVLVDWMVVASIPFRDAVFSIHPPWYVILGGILFHQWADFAWALVFFGLLGRWTDNLSPRAIACIAAPWALFTSSLEWLFLVPLLPFQQPIFTLEQVYWLGFFVHLSSSAVYPIFPWIRDRILRRDPSPNRRFGKRWTALGLTILAALGMIAGCGVAGREIAWQGRNPAFDQAFMRQMAAHHAQGLALAELGAARATDPHLRAIAKLIGAAQLGEIRILSQWWRSWFGSALPPTRGTEHAAMPGMLTPAQFAAVHAASSAGFDRCFVDAVTFHHQGAFHMANDALESASDVRVRLMAHAIRHEQTGEIALMHGIRPGRQVLRIGLSSLLGAPGEHTGARTTTQRVVRNACLA